ncbi:hypothetical protein Lesp02_16150 [Lentzea sp. NBRC 105346]|uniref:YqeB family protein n=1 Tax=Lentzea sp. NBRC 105346 TaxID=3032205 RepID=UPI0024A48D29|nr:hypothetical protein [Lentzea sp. NBRC 105346]GLZ29425.1 hypothetical protein Lesp02_16150 [Lentzea sp. NBRC 105346]
MTTVRESAAVRYGIWVLCPALGALVLWGLTSIAAWVADLRWFPFQGVFELVASIPSPYRVLGALTLGVVLGLALAFLWAVDMLSVTVSPTEVVLQRDDKRQSFTSVRSAYVDGKHLVLLDSSDAELAREPSDLAAADLQAAFSAHGYSWLSADPFTDSYRMWVDHAPDLPAEVNSLLRERLAAVRKSSDDVGLLSAELRKHGVYVRDVKKRQYWRT